VQTVLHKYLDILGHCFPRYILLDCAKRRSYALCPAERQCASTHWRSCSSTAHSGIHSALFIILMPPASTCCGGTSCRAMALSCWQRSYSFKELCCTSRISSFDEKFIVSLSGGVMHGCANRLAMRFVLVACYPPYSPSRHEVCPGVELAHHVLHAVNEHRHRECPALQLVYHMAR
jgi:hypothetical protein